MPIEQKRGTFAHSELLKSAWTVIAAVLLLLLIKQAAHVLLLAFCSVLFAIGLRTLASLLSRAAGTSQQTALFIIVPVLFAVIIFSGWLIAPRINMQLRQLSETLPRSAEKVNAWIENQPWAAWLPKAQWQKSVPAPLVITRATNAFYTAAGVILSLVVVVSMAVYMAADPSLYVSGFLSLLPRRMRGRGEEVLNAAGGTLRWWLIGQLGAMTCVGVLTAAGLSLLGIPLAVTLAVIAFLLDFVPYFGPIIASVPAILIGLTINIRSALYVALLYLVIQQVEGLIIVPLIQKNTARLPPVLTVIAVTLFGVFLGPLGFLLAAPLMVCVVVVTKMVYIEGILEQNGSTEAAVQD